MKKAKSVSPDWQTLPKDIWRSIGATATLSPLDVSRLRATCVFFRCVIVDTAQNFRDININTALARAADGGHRDIVELMIEKGATRLCLIFALSCAAQGGHRDIIGLLIEKGANDFNSALCMAAAGGHRDIVELMIEKGATDFNWALYRAAEGGHRDIVELLKQKGATKG